MKILVITQYFWPENFRINDLCLGLVDKGHEVEVLTGIPNYPKGKLFEGYKFSKKNDEIWKNIKIHRSKLIERGKGGLQLFINYFSFAFFASWKGLFLKGKYDCILVYEPSPITVGIPAILISKKKKIPYYFWVQDLWPESLIAAGGIENKLIISIFNSLTKLIYNKSRKVLVQSQGFKDYIINQNIPENKIIYYPNSTEEFYKPVKVTEEYKSKLPKGFIITFAGNFGEAQSLRTLLYAAREVKNRGYNNIKWVFLGDGRQKQEIVEFINQNNLNDVIFLPGYYPTEEMPHYFSCSDALIVSLKKDKIFSLTIPSKIQSYLACAKPIIASLDGEGANIILNANAGFASEAENFEELANNIIKLYKLSNSERQTMGENARKYFLNNFERNMLLNTLIEILN